MADVQLKNVRKVYDGDVEAVRDFNLEIEDGEFVVFVGPSGCGKSTTLRMVAGLEEITDGTVDIGGREVNDVPPKDRDIAMVFQNYALYPHMTVRDNMAFGLKLRKFKKDEIEARIQEAARMLDLGDYLERRPKALSGGQRQRVAVGRAIVRKPAVFLFDEPLSNLDAKLRVQMRVEIKRLHATLRTTMIYVTHDQVEAMTMGDRIVVMKDGVMQQVADPLSLYEFPTNRFVAGFIGMPPMNFFEGKVSQSADGLVFTSTSGFTLPVSQRYQSAAEAHIDKAVTLGVRPEDIGSAVAEGLEGAPRIEATVDVVEPMGSETYAYLTLGEDRFVSRVDAHRQFEVGQQVSEAVFLDKVHFFSAETGERLTHT